MTRAEIEAMLEEYGADAATIREQMKVTRMVTDADIQTAKDMTVAAYMLPYLRDLPQPFTTIDPDTEEEVVDAEELSAFVGHLRSLIYARLLYDQLYKTEYTTSLPNKLNASIPSVSEVSRQVSAYRRDGMQALIDYYRQEKGKRVELPRIYRILGDEL